MKEMFFLVGCVCVCVRMCHIESKNMPPAFFVTLEWLGRLVDFVFLPVKLCHRF